MGCTTATITQCCMCQSWPVKKWKIWPQSVTHHKIHASLFLVSHGSKMHLKGGEGQQLDALGSSPWEHFVDFPLTLPPI